MKLQILNLIFLLPVAIVPAAMRVLIISFITIALWAPSAEGFMLLSKPVAALHEIAEAQFGTLMNVRLDVGDQKDMHVLLDGLSMELTSNKVAASSTKSQAGMPGYHQPNRQASSGICNIQVHSKPSFIDITGRRYVTLNDGCWELIWFDGSPSGRLVCGFSLPTEVKRNSAKLSAGTIYLMFHIWTPDGLAAEQARRFEAEQRAQGYLQERDVQLQKCQDTSNILLKALHYRNAAEAVEKYSLTGVSYMDHIPSGPSGVMPLGGGSHLVSATGRVLATQGGSPIQNRVGTATIIPSRPETAVAP